MDAGNLGSLLCDHKRREHAEHNAELARGVQRDRPSHDRLLSHSGKLLVRHGLAPRGHSGKRPRKLREQQRCPRAAHHGGRAPREHFDSREVWFGVEAGRRPRAASLTYLQHLRGEDVAVPVPRLAKTAATVTAPRAGAKYSIEALVSFRERDKDRLAFLGGLETSVFERRTSS